MVKVVLDIPLRTLARLTGLSKDTISRRIKEGCLRQVCDKCETNVRHLTFEMFWESVTYDTDLRHMCDTDETDMRQTEEKKEPKKEEKNNKDKENINIKNNINIQEKEKPTTSFQEELRKKEEEFKESLQPYRSLYGDEMIDRFYDYWSERKGVTGRLMRWEKEKTWDLNRRLQRWERNNYKPQQSRQQIDEIGIIYNNDLNKYEKGW